jgi:hypothetical protein
MIYILLLLLVVIMVCFISNNKESFIQNGICECCKCGFISCKECSTRTVECCGNNSFAFDRYTFNHQS